MAGAKKTPEQAIQAVVLREAGYSLPVIAARLEMSVSTTQRLLKKHPAVAGATTQALIAKAREDLINSVFSLESVQLVAASLAAGELSALDLIRLRLTEAIESLDTTGANAPLACRALAACATTLRLTQEVGRKALPLEKLGQALETDELPELIIHVMTEQDVLDMRAEQRRYDAEMNGSLNEDEIQNEIWRQHKLGLLNKPELDDDIIEES